VHIDDSDIRLRLQQQLVAMHLTTIRPQFRRRRDTDVKHSTVISLQTFGRQDVWATAIGRLGSYVFSTAFKLLASGVAGL